MPPLVRRKPDANFETHYFQAERVSCVWYGKDPFGFLLSMQYLNCDAKCGTVVPQQVDLFV